MSAVPVDGAVAIRPSGDDRRDICYILITSIFANVFGQPGETFVIFAGTNILAFLAESS